MVKKEKQLVLVGAKREPAGVRLLELCGYNAIQSIEDMRRDEAEKWANVLKDAYGLKGLEVPAYV